MMVAPSENIEFFESLYFKKVTAPVPEIRLEVLKYLRTWPTSGTAIAKAVKEVKITIAGKDYAVIYKRTANKLGIMHLYTLPQEEKDLEATKAKIVELFGK
jgi:hypothetical protein